MAVLNVPGGQFLHCDMPMRSLYVPRSHEAHELDPRKLYVPRGQAVQFDRLVSPEREPNVPFGQSRQLRAPTRSWYVPALHDRQTEAPLREYVPIGHVVQSFTVVSPSRLLNVPAGHFLQLLLPGRF